MQPFHLHTNSCKDNNALRTEMQDATPESLSGNDNHRGCQSLKQNNIPTCTSTQAPQTLWLGESNLLESKTGNPRPVPSNLLRSVSAESKPKTGGNYRTCTVSTQFFQFKLLGPTLQTHSNLCIGLGKHQLETSHPE